MTALSVDWRDLVITVAVFFGVILAFGLLSAGAGWPNDEGGWLPAIIIALVIALLPMVPRALTFLQQSRASIEAPFGIKINFANAAVEGQIRTSTLPGNMVQPGTQIQESGHDELERAAITATEQTVVVINLEDGRAWYLTRLFAVAATAALLGAPKIMVLIGQRGGKPLQVGGWIRPQDFVTALKSRNPGYEWVWRQASKYLQQLRAHAGDPLHNPAGVPRFGGYAHSYEEFGDTLVMRILIDQMRQPDPVPNPPEPLEKESNPPWVTLEDVQRMLDPWLIRDTVDISGPDKSQVDAILAAEGDIVLAVRDGQFAGIIDVRRAERQVLRQLIQRAAA